MEILILIIALATLTLIVAALALKYKQKKPLQESNNILVEIALPERREESDDKKPASVLIELANVRQNENEHFRKCFYNETFDLTVWYEDEDCKKITGFQLCYGDFLKNHVITAHIGQPISYTIADDSKRLQSPILRSNGFFDAEAFEKKYGSIKKMLPDDIEPYFADALKELQNHSYVRNPILREI